MKFLALRRLGFVTFVMIAAAGLAWQVVATRSTNVKADTVMATSKADILHDLGLLTPKIQQFEDQEAQTDIRVIDSAKVQQEISDVTYNAALGDLKASRLALLHLTADLDAWKAQFETTSKAEQAKAAAAAVAAAVPTAVPHAANGGLQVPIVLYHYTPADFAQQLQYLQQHGYTTITLDQLVSALTSGGALPAKPVVLTFDDGYEDQMKAFGLLQAYQMKATFYIIVGGAGSNGCIGTSRYNASCGDATLNWDQVRQLDSSGLITIGSHTVNHLNLASLSADQQRFEIFQGKAQLEAQLGHSVSDFAYPYGSYNATTVALVREAGFVTAVTTTPGTYQTAGNLLTLYRIRTTLKLP